ncbi:class I SAM-dependent methyltransferase [Mycolicibacterium holsaticum]|uniref:class I SAM-dependent methyltransferase n=1 Tax=Mycolicibacterium holsaticum TaxID=152142 RepID=UPI001C7CCBD7|nr:class I SAM-dependent methyltransferase [Mycolicibacterium holsaticum]QZA11373.1 class I SAM-dependent methyltransferase [Mycolicibacterium holsaticum DSM 44478 = JCM 12374]UNC11135.1 class I SAM-dependent methyltransferase [Mycolicibacterium holsaticum DSM 44478 = JCM 12374]
MSRNLARYRAIGHRVVTGFLQPEVLLLLDVLNTAQRSDQVSGAVAEIGVHHGKLFIGLQLLQRPGERSVAIDIFGDQELNVDGSGHGDLAKFVNNMNLWSSMDDVAIHQGDSTKLLPETLRELAGGDIRFFSVDGGHTDEIVFSDMKLAEATLADGGVVIADDVFNQQWPGVAVGTLRYLESGAKLAPFLIGFNKVFFAQPDYCGRYRSAVESAVDGKLRLATADSVFAGHDVGLVASQGVVDLLRRSATMRSLYHRAYRDMVRGLQFVSHRGGSGQ